MTLIQAEEASTFSKGALVWFDQGDYPIPAEIVEVDLTVRSAKITSSLFGDENAIVASFSQLQHRSPPDQDLSAIDDLVQINDLSEGTLLWTIKTRYDQGKIHTYIGGALLSINRGLGSLFDESYGQDVIQRYCNRVLGSLPPHIFAMAESAYADMRASRRDQVLIASGESGSGKTETCKLLMRYLTSAAPCSRGRNEPGRKNVTVEQILAAAPVLESFGNAATPINENATRCAFTVELAFQQGVICGAEYIEYALEKNRIVSHNNGERNFHVFYELLAGLKDELKEKFGLSNAEKYFYLNQGKMLELRSRADKENFRLLHSAMDALGFGGDHKHSIFRVLAAILHIGNLYFNKQQTQQHQEAVSIGNESEVQWISYLLQLDVDVLKSFLTTKSTEVRDDRVSTPLNIDKALDIRDAMAKALYTQLFSWLVSRINQSVRKSEKESSIILLDTFGFECLKVNSFEQLCINYSNERVHAYFVESMFRKEQDEYSHEKIVWREKIGSQMNNQPILDLLARRPNGVFHLLDDECSFPKGTDESFLHKCHYSHVDNPFYGKPRMHNPEFCVRHFAGPAWYDASAFVEKNRDVMKSNVVDVLTESQNSMISQIFKNWKNAQQSVVKTKLPSAMATFANGLNLLMKKIVKYRCLVSKECVKNVGEREACNLLLSLIAPQFIHCCQIGASKVFLKEAVYESLEQCRQRRLYAAAVIIQKNARAYVLRKGYSQKRLSAVKIQAVVRGWLARNYYRRLKSAVLRDAEQQAKRSRQLQMYERMRQEAAVMDETDGDKRQRNFAIAGVHHLDLPDELVAVLDNMPEWDRRNRQERLVRSAVSDVLLLPNQGNRHVLPPDLDNYSFPKFAHANFKTHVLQMRREPVATPFLPKDNDADFQDSLVLFKLILRYMNDVSLTFTQETMLANFIVQKGLSKPVLRDEIYAQLINQTYANPHPANQERGWALIGLCASAFPPSPAMYKYVLNYVTGADSNNGYRFFLEKRLSQCAHSEWSLTRRYPPCLIEHKAAQEKGKMALTATLADGSKRKCQVEPWTTAGEFAQAILRESGVDETRGWTVSFNSTDVDIRLNATDYLLDVISYFELPNTFPAMKSEFLVSPKTANSKDHGKERNSGPGEFKSHEQLNHGAAPRQPPANATSHTNRRPARNQHDAVNEGMPPPNQRPHAAPANHGHQRNQSSSSSPVSDPTQETSAPAANMNCEIGVAQPADARQSQPRFITVKQEQGSGQQARGQARGGAGAFHLPPHNHRSQQKARSSPAPTHNLNNNTHHCEKAHLFGATNGMEQRNVGCHHDSDSTRAMAENLLKPQETRKDIPDVVLPPLSHMKTATNMAEGMSNIGDELGHYRGGVPRGRIAPSEYSLHSMASHVRNVAIPSKNSDVEKFLDDLFEPVLHDSTVDDIYDLRSIAASIKGGGDNSTLPRTGRGGVLSPQPPMMLTTTHMMPTLMPHMSQPVIMMMPMDSMRMFNMGAVGNSTESFLSMQNGDFSTLNSHSSIDHYRHPLALPDTASLFSQMTMTNNHHQHRSRNPMDNPQQAYSYQQQLHLSPVPSAGTTMYAPAMLSPTPSTITAITAPTMPVMPLQVSTFVPMSVTALASPVLAVQQPTSPISIKQMTSQHQHAIMSPTGVPPEPSYPAPSMPRHSMHAPDPPAVVHIPSDRPHPMARHQTVPIAMQSQMKDSRAQMNDHQYGNGYHQYQTHHPSQQQLIVAAAHDKSGQSFEHYANRQKQQHLAQGNYRLNNYPGTVTMTSSMTGDEPSIDYDDDETSGTLSATVSNQSYATSGFGQRNRRFFSRNPPPTTITEETSEESEAFDRQGNGFLVGRMKPTSNNARYVGSVQIGGHDRGSDPAGYTTHTIRDITKAAREGQLSPQGAPMPQMSGTIPAVILPSNADIHPSQLVDRRGRTVYSPSGIPSPPTVYPSDNRYIQDAALDKMKRNATHLPPPVDEVKLIRHQTQLSSPDRTVQMEHHCQMDQLSPQFIRHKGARDAHDASNARHAGDKYHQSNYEERHVEQRSGQTGTARRERISKEQEKQLQRQQYEAYLAAEREWMAQMKTSGRAEDDPADKSGPTLHQHGDEYDRYAFSKIGFAHSSVAAAGKKSHGRADCEQEQFGSHGDGEQDRFGDWVQEKAKIPAYRAFDCEYREDGHVQYGYDGNDVENEDPCPKLHPSNHGVASSCSQIWTPPRGDASKDLEFIRGAGRDPRRKGPLFTYEDAPWTFRVQKELFYPNESFDSQEKLDLVFLQIVRDVVEWNPFRIQKHDRDQMLATLDHYGIDVEQMPSSKLASSVKKRIIDTARTWPLYFCRFYPIVEDRKSEYIAQWLAISETGIRFVVRSYVNPNEPLKIVDHFEYEDLDRIEVPEQGVLLLTTFNKRQVRLFASRAESIKALIDDYLYGPNQGKEYVRACADYITKEANLLSFRKGDIIQLVTNMQDNYMGSGWLYGKLNNRYGNFPSNYVESLSGDIMHPGINGLHQPCEFDDGMAPIGNVDDLGNEGSMHRHGKGKLTMMEFAMLHYKHAPSGGKVEDGEIKAPKKSKKEWTWKEFADMVKFSKSPIQSSLLKLDKSELNKLAVECFINIMTYMGDYPLKKDATYIDCVYKLLMACHHHPSMRDEVYCQIVKQTTNNKSSKPDSAILGWRLFSILTAYFDCTDVLKPYLVKYLAEAANDVRRAYHGTATICLQNMKQTFRYGGRKYLLSAMEIESITNGKNLKRQVYHLPGGTKKVVNTRSISVVEEVIRELCQELNIRSPLEQQEFCLCYVVESDNTMKLMANDEYILDVTTEMEFKRKDYFLLLKRTVWIHPLRLDNDLYIDVMFFQVVPDYLEGLLVIMHSPETISASFMDDIARLGALLHCADDHWDGQYVNSRVVAQLLPRIVQNLRHVNLEQWSDRVNAKLRQLSQKITTTQARAKFLEILQTWTLFGSTFFYTSHVGDPRVQGECLMAINKHGVQFLHMITHETLLDFRLNEILSTQKVMAANPSTGQPVQFLDMKVGNMLQQRVISLQTDQSAEISRLLGQYIYVDSQNRGFITGNHNGVNAGVGAGGLVNGR